MNPNFIIYVVSGILLLWSLALTYFYFATFRHLKALRVGLKDESLTEVLSALMRKFMGNEARLKELEFSITKLKKDDLANISKAGLVRFNPFDDTGSNQSFSLALLDKNNDGFVLTSLHARSGTRVYLKPVKAGARENYELSKEEEEAISKAKNKNL